MKTTFWKLILFVGDLGSLYLSVLLALLFRHFAWPSEELAAIHLWYFSPLLFAWLSSFYIFGLYSRAVIYFKSRVVNLLSALHLLNLFVLAIPFFFMANLPISPKIVLMIFFTVSLPVLLLWRVYIFPQLLSNIKINILTLNLKREDLHVLRDLNTNSFFSINIEKAKLKELKDKLKSEQTIDYSIYPSESDRVNLLLTLISTGQLGEFNVIKKEEIYEFLGRVPETEWISVSGKLLYACKSPLKKIYSIFRVLFDYFLAILLLPVLLPVLLIIALLILLIDGRPVFYKSKRRGYLGKDFVMYKFRTMTGTDSGDEAKHSKLEVTKLGAVLRKTRLDELPQILNIFKGEIATVGPRPEISEIADDYEAKMPMYKLRYMIKPGVTGWAQIYHRNHPHHKSDLPAAKEKMEYDIYYLTKRSFILDMHIMAQTIMTLLTLQGK